MVQETSALKMTSGILPGQESVSHPVQLRLRIAVHSGDSILLLRISDIIRCEASSNYCIIHSKGGRKTVVSKTLKHISGVLPASGFARVHQSHLISIGTISEVFTDHIVLDCGAKIPVSRSRRRELRDLIDSLSISI